MREQVADGLPALTVRLELPGGLQERPGLGECDAWSGEGVWLAMIAIEKWLRVKRIDCARAALHEEEDGPLGLRLEMRLGRRGHRLGEERVERQCPKPEGGVLEQLTASGKQH